MKKPVNSNLGGNRLFEALNEPIREVDGMSSADLGRYLEGSGFERAGLKRSLASRLRKIEAEAGFAETIDATDLATRFGRVKSHLSAIVGESAQRLSSRFEGLVAASPQRAAQIVNELEKADEDSLKELYEALKDFDISLDQGK